jgi:hypothetical protein
MRPHSYNYCSLLLMLFAHFQYDNSAKENKNKIKQSKGVEFEEIGYELTKFNQHVFSFFHIMIFLRC